MTTPLRGAAAPAADGIAPADPVKALLARHRALCERAADPLEIAAHLEAHGVCERTAARCRHRDVFSLAEELHARAMRGTAPARGAHRRFKGAPAAPRALWSRARFRGGAHRAGPSAAPAPAMSGERAVRAGWLPRALMLAACAWLTAYALVGDRVAGVLLRGTSGGGHSGTAGALLAAVRGAGSGVPATALALGCALAPAAWCARWFTARVRRALVGSRALTEFGARVRPELLATVALFSLALAALLWAAHAALGPGRAGAARLAALTALGALLFLARLLSVRGLTAPGVVAALTACAVEAAALLALGAPPLPGRGALAPLGPAVVRAAGWCGPAAIPLAACVPCALALLAHALSALSRASAHRRGTRRRPRVPSASTDRSEPHPLSEEQGMTANPIRTAGRERGRER
ncbi:hypothetical protein ACFP1Z_01205 [Streptomyces gamaensis]|uniref:Integral membrane protein n=1 Tax=Streptomyces gamaensis TaxID=1763542 RepID=A0ABW0YWK6_9ACTN